MVSERPLGMGKWVHRLSAVDLVERTAFCQGCGERVAVVGGRRPLCRNQRNEEKARYRAANRDKIRAAGAKYREKKRGGRPSKPRGERKGNGNARHRLDPQSIEQMKERCGGCCEICGRSDVRRLVVDHCHVTGKIRGMLCDRCNQAIGALGDNAESLERALRYLHR